MSGNRLFLLYAFACAEDRLRVGLISQSDFEMLSALITSQSASPTVEALERCFPKAVRNYLAWCKQYSKTPWTQESVTEYWRDYHGDRPDCAVHRALVLSTNDELQVSVRGSKGVFFALNRYQLPLVPGDLVCIHRNFIVEKV
jgi:hypothetical protein